MSRWGKIGWTLCALSFFLLIGARFVLTGWDSALALPLSLFLGSFLFSIAIDMRFYLNLFKMRATQHSLNMGVLSVLFLVSLISINVLSLRYKMAWDLTEGKVNSLTETTLQWLNTLDKDIKITVFYSGVEALQARLEVKELLQKYKDQSRHLKIEFVDSYIHKRRAHEYLNNAELSGLTVFFELKDKKVGVSAPIDEEKITLSLVTVTREKTKKIYFLTGHGERSIGDHSGEGVKSLAEFLGRMSFKVEELNLFDTKIVPIDADALVMAGPQSPYILSEIEVIEKFLKRGGSLMVAADPNKKHQLAGWLKKWGVDFKDNLVVSPFLILRGRGQTVASGRIYNETHEITKKFGFNTLTIFDWTSELELLKKSPFQSQRLIHTDGNALSVNLNQAEEKTKTDQAQQRTLAISLKGKYPDSSGGLPSPDCRIIVFGDSDFLSEKDIVHYANRELAMNSIAYLTGEEDVLNITPPSWADSPTRMTPYQLRGIILGSFSIPLIMLLLAAFCFYWRRNL